MDRSKTFVHFLAAIAFIAMAIVLFSIAGGSISMERVQKENGAYTFGGSLPFSITFSICLILLAAIITVLQEGEFMDWLPSCGVIVLISGVSLLFGFSMFAGVVLGGLYTVWWLIASIKTLRASWGYNGFFADALLALCRFVLTGALFTLVMAWGMLPVSIGSVPDMEVISRYGTIAGVGSILAAVALCVEGGLWIKYSDY